MRRQDLAKLVTMIALVTILTVFSQYKVTLASSPTGYSALPDSARGKVTVTSFNGAAKTQVTNAESYVQTAPDTVSSWDAEKGVTISHTNVAATGCESIFTDNINLNFTIANRLASPAQGALNVSVYNDKTGALMDSRLVMLSFVPGQDTYASFKFGLLTGEIQPIFRVTATFPSGMAAVPVTTKQVSLLEFLLMQAGILAK